MSAPPADPINRFILDAYSIWIRHYPGIPLVAVTLSGLDPRTGEVVKLPVPVPVAPLLSDESD